MDLGAYRKLGVSEKVDENQRLQRHLQELRKKLASLEGRGGVQPRGKAHLRSQYNKIKYMEPEEECEPDYSSFAKNAFRDGIKEVNDKVQDVKGQWDEII